MRKRVSKKFVIALAAGALSLVMAIGGTYAWFTSTAKGGPGTDFTAATVSLTKETGKSGFTIMQFNLNLRPQTPDINPQFRMEDAIASSMPQAGINDQAGYWFVEIFLEDINTTANAADWEEWLFSKLQPDDDNDVDNWFDANITPGSFVKTELAFTNESNVYTYLRIEAKGLNPDSQMKAAYFVVITDDKDNIVNVDYSQGYPVLESEMYHATGEKDSYFYMPTALSPEEEADSNEYKVWLCAYVFGNLNGNESNNADISDPDSMHKFTLGTLTAEVIQASNNAVFLANDGWSDFATTNPDFFVEPDWTVSP